MRVGPSPMVLLPTITSVALGARLSRVPETVEDARKMVISQKDLVEIDIRCTCFLQAVPGWML